MRAQPAPGAAPPKAKPKWTADNRAGMILCNRLMTQSLTPRERAFVSSIMRQIMAKPDKFAASEKQWKWLRDIWWKYFPDTEPDTAPAEEKSA